MKKQEITEPTRLTILQEIFEQFQYATQWFPYDNFLSNLKKAEALIELLEVHDCSFIGGFDENQNGEDDLYDRFLCLCNKYNQLNNIKKVCYFTPKKMRKYFDKIKNLREYFNVT